MPRKKLTPEQLEQEAAMKEIEAILNMKEPVISPQPAVISPQPAVISQKREALKKTRPILSKLNNANKKKAKNVAVKRQSDRSPYLVDLKRVAKQREGTERQKSKGRQWSQFIQHLIPSPQIGTGFVKSFTSIKKNTFNTTKSLKDKSSQYILASKSTAISWKDRIAGYYEKHRKILDELIVVNILMLIGLILWQIGKALYRAMFFVGWNGWRLFQTVVRGIKHSKIVAAMGQFWKSVTGSLFRSFKSAGLASKKIIDGARSGVVASAAQAGESAKQGVGSINSMWQSLKDWRPPALPIKFLPPLSWQRQLIIFICLALALIIPFKVLSYFQVFQTIKGKVLGESEEAMLNLQQAAQDSSQLNFARAASHFSQATDNFSQAQAALTQYSDLIKMARILPSQKAKVAAQSEKLIASGKTAAQIGEYLSLALVSLKIGKNDSEQPVTERLKNFSYYSTQALGELEKFANNINSISPDVIAWLVKDNSQVTQQFNFLKSNVELFKIGVQELVALSDALQIFLGDQIDTRYLLIFQNNAEMRASGGFIGSYAVVDFRQGEIKSLEVPAGGSYDLQGGLHRRIAAPQPMHLINSLWEFQDANWWPDWPKSAEKITWFFENGWGSSVDGVLAIDPTFIEALLEVIGPVDLTKEYGTLINKDNFYDIVQTQAERKDTRESKKIIRDMFAKIVDELPERVNDNNFVTLLKVVEQALLEKHILLQFNEPILQQFVREHNWDGRIKETSGDYLAVINTNIAGGKSDRKIKQNIDHTAQITPDGSIVNTVVIKRQHTAEKGELFSGVRNVNYIRIYVPKGSQLLEAEGFSAPALIYFDEPAEGAEADVDIYLVENITKVDEESGVRIYTEFGKTVFAHWTMVDPGQTITVKLKYKLPFKVNSIKENSGLITSILSGDTVVNPYSFLVQKQSGSIKTDFRSKLILPADMQIVWFRQDENGITDSGWEVKDNLRQDKFWGVLIEKE